MYARKVTMKLKPNKSAEFTKRLEADVIPLLRKQKGFQNEIAFAANGGKEAFGISLWDRKESADAYEKNTYAQVTKMMESVIDGTPDVDGYEVSASTFPKSPAAHTK
jgi:hypothetical protein